MTPPYSKPTNGMVEGVAAPVSALVNRMPAEPVHFRARPAQSASPGRFVPRVR